MYFESVGKEDGSTKKYVGGVLLGILTFLIVGHVQAATREELLKYIPEPVLDSLPEATLKDYERLDMSKAKSDEITINDSKYPTELSPLSDDLWTTTYKKLKITMAPYDSTTYAVMLDLTWLYIPAVRSYDVIALRFESAAMAKSSATGVQSYVLSNGDEDAVGYSSGGTNMVMKDNGYGISMNLVDNKLNNLFNHLSVNVAASGSSGMAYGSYQHAVDNVSLTQSKNYNISAAGMGRVINFAQSVWDHYDNMQGVKVRLGL